jgi:hypothetical protein
MSKPYRRFEMLLPTLFNDGSPVPEGLIAEMSATSPFRTNVPRHYDAFQ